MSPSPASPPPSLNSIGADVFADGKYIWKAELPLGTIFTSFSIEVVLFHYISCAWLATIIYQNIGGGITDLSIVSVNVCLILDSTTTPLALFKLCAGLGIGLVSVGLTFSLIIQLLPSFSC